MAQSIVPTLVLPSPDVVSLKGGFPYAEMAKKAAQLFCNATSHCAVSFISITVN